MPMGELTTYGGRPLEAEPIIHVLGSMEFEGMTFNVECHEFQADFTAGIPEDSFIHFDQCVVKSMEYEAHEYTKDWYTKPKAMTFTFPRGLPRRTLPQWLAQVRDRGGWNLDFLKRFVEESR